MRVCNSWTSTSDESRPDDGPRILERSETSFWKGLGGPESDEPAPRASWAIEGVIF